MNPESVVLIDLRRVEDKCGVNKLEAFQSYIFSAARPGVTYKVVSRDPDTQYSLKSLAGDYGFEVLGEGEDEKAGYYYVLLRFRA